MFNQIALSPDELTVVLYCLDQYCGTLDRQVSEDSLTIEAFHFSKSHAESLIDQLYSAKSLSTEQIDQVTSALWAWKALSGNSSVSVEPLYDRLLEAKLEARLWNL